MAEKYPYTKFRFKVEVNNVLVAEVTEVTGFDASVDVIEYREGNERPTPRKVQGLRKFGNITLKTGLIDTHALYDWLNPANEKAAIPRHDVVITLLAEDMTTPIATWQIEAAWPTKYTGPDLNATSSEVAFESIELAHEGLKRTL
ncbi:MULTISPECIES: phage tail protein [Clostridium]|uniref:Phage tail region protein n=1 Tax=Clostridium carnis TaxID=1530 RepID=A0ABY6SNS3_9CLOT|nr:MULTISPECIES: phage tail protein [Clostridium]DAQ72407.1 MAG TPA: major tail protein [Caudoviricetes sp.]CAI3624749.1 Phage tail region protein [Clostridium neonatale]CAI3629272.1 Phage tail region protein [Clostridium neonatale]CAI3663981.1 Phage tail region protein [Clostridium neonatale]CAI3667852.1 Phage tail region protein [Clostridium neonatale]